MGKHVAGRLAAQLGEDYVSIADIADLVGTSTKTIRRALDAGKIPEPDLRLSKRMVRWRLSTIRSWTETRGTNRSRRAPAPNMGIAA